MSSNKPHLSKLKGLVNTPYTWEGYCEMLDYNILQQQRKLEQSVEMVDIYKAQGAIIALRQLKYLRDEVNVKE